MNHQNTTLQLQLQVEDVNMIFKALGRLPFQEVYELIGKINSQVNAQLPLPGNNPQISNPFKADSDTNT